MQWYKSLSFTQKMLVAMIAGAILGIVLGSVDVFKGWVEVYLSFGLFDIIGKLFVNSLKILVLPLGFCSIAVGVSSLANISLMGRVGLKAIIIYLFTTAIAISLALIVAITINPGKGLDIADTSEFTVKEAPSITSVITSIIPSNPVLAMAEGEMLQIILFSILLGVAITLSASAGEPIKKGLQSLNSIMMAMVNIVMKFTPLGVFCLIAKTFATQGVSMIIPLASYFFTVDAVLLLHVLITYSVLLKVIAKVSPIIFIKKMRDAVVFAFSTASSNATIPVTLNTVEKKL